MTIAPYIALMRLDKPIGIWLLFFPAAWAVALAASDAEVGSLMLVMLAGATLTRAAGCILNDLTDRKLDAQVERTKSRPLASGAIKPWQAVMLLLILLLAALVLTLSLPPQVFWLALVALPMIAAYPWMKRLTWWPQAFLGLTFNLGTLFGWLAAGEPISLLALMLYAASICWTLGYDTIYAVQDMADDAAIGIRSSARALGMGRIRSFVAGCYCAMFALLGSIGLIMEVGIGYWLGWALATMHARWQISALPPSAERAGALFRSNQWVGLIVLMGLLAERLL
jgi:4-hydroxybenzoate polyprenyltransferase